jgi:hypothetical protein
MEFGRAASARLNATMHTLYTDSGTLDDRENLMIILLFSAILVVKNYSVASLTIGAETDPDKLPTIFSIQPIHPFFLPDLGLMPNFCLISSSVNAFVFVRNISASSCFDMFVCSPMGIKQFSAR